VSITGLVTTARPGTASVMGSAMTVMDQARVSVRAVLRTPMWALVAAVSVTISGAGINVRTLSVPVTRNVCRTAAAQA
jgi:hypothetical protein